MSTEAREEDRIPFDEALALLTITPNYDPGGGPTDCVHTKVQSGPMLIGAHWTLEQIKVAGEKYGFFETGPEASRMGYAVAIPERKEDGHVMWAFCASRVREAVTA